MMTIDKAMKARHAVRDYTLEPICDSDRQALEQAISDANTKSGLNIQLVLDEPRAFSTGRAHFGKFTGVRNYLVLAGPNSKDLEEKAGYYGEGIVLLATSLGLQSCWVALTFGKGAVKGLLRPGEKLALVVSLGHGVTQGTAHKSKPIEDLADFADGMNKDSAPEWFMRGMQAAQLAPTAMNQQKFRITCTGPESAKIENLGGPYSKVDLGIVRHDFEQAAGKDVFTWQ